MNYRLIEKIEIRDGKVYIKTPCSATLQHQTAIYSHSNLCEDSILTKLLQTDGQHAVFKEIGKAIFEGTIVMHPRNCPLAEQLKRAGELIRVPLKYSLDADHAGEFIATVVEGYENNTFYSPVQELAKLAALRSAPEEVFSICKNNPAAFHFSEEHVRRNRELARRYIFEFIHTDGFFYPTYFRSDKELAIEALLKNASVFRQLDACLRNDMDIVRLAYLPSVARKEQDFFVSYISEPLRFNAFFMQELTHKCPDLRFDDCMDVLDLPGVAETWAIHNEWVHKDMTHLPLTVLIKPTVRNALRTRFANDPPSLATLDTLIDYALHSVKPMKGQSLSANLPSRRSAPKTN